MNKFQGQYRVKIDAKGRMVLPAKLKSCLPESHNKDVVLFQGEDDCIEVFTQDVWVQRANKVANISRKGLSPEKVKQVKVFQRQYFSRSLEVELDANGRLLIPKAFLEFAQIEKEIVVVGEWNKIELWNPGCYERFIAEDDVDFSEMLSEFL